MQPTDRQATYVKARLCSYYSSHNQTPNGLYSNRQNRIGESSVFADVETLYSVYLPHLRQNLDGTFHESHLAKIIPFLIQAPGPLPNQSIYYTGGRPVWG